MKYCIILFFLVCFFTLDSPFWGHAQITVPNSQVKKDDKSNAPRFTPSQMSARRETTSPQPAPVESQRGTTGTSQDVPQAETSAPTAGTTPSAAGQASQSQSAQDPAVIPHRGSNAVITITPSTALKSASKNSPQEGESEENSITGWSSNATKAIIHYKEPEEEKPSTGAPQLRPLN